MAYVYASPLSTHVLQLRDIPPRPPSYDGCALACEISPQLATEALRAKLSAFGTLVALTREPPDAAEARVRFASHAEAEAAAAGGVEALGGGAYVCLEYNERPFAERGWCVAEEVFSTECMVSLHGQLPKLARPKIAALRADGSSVEVVPEERSAAEVYALMKSTTFLGKGDRATVMKIYQQLQWRLRYDVKFGGAKAARSIDNAKREELR